LITWYAAAVSLILIPKANPIFECKYKMLARLKIKAEKPAMMEFQNQNIAKFNFSTSSLRNFDFSSNRLLSVVDKIEKIF